VAAPCVGPRRHPFLRPIGDLNDHSGKVRIYELSRTWAWRAANVLRWPPRNSCRCGQRATAARSAMTRPGRIRELDQAQWQQGPSRPVCPQGLPGANPRQPPACFRRRPILSVKKAVTTAPAAPSASAPVPSAGPSCCPSTDNRLPTRPTGPAGKPGRPIGSKAAHRCPKIVLAPRQKPALPHTVKAVYGGCRRPHQPGPSVRLKPHPYRPGPLLRS